MKRIDVNCDVGEGIENELDLIPYIQSCNIACGGHAGDEQIMRRVINLAIKYNVKIGAHPSYPDRNNFGRISVVMSQLEFEKSIINQINILNKIIIEEGGRLHHIKPHGALYNDIMKNDELSIQFLNSIKSFKKNTKLYVPYNSLIALNAEKLGYSLIYEAFGDRSYDEDLSLVSRNKKNAVFTSSVDVINQISEILNTKKVTTISGSIISLKADTFCIHSDTKNAVEIIKKITKHFHEI